MRATIYGLCDPTTLELRYVGKTVVKPLDRLIGHIALAKREKNHRAAWINSLVRAGQRPIMEVFDEVSGDGCAEEISAIGIAKALGCRLVNATRGGEGTPGRVVSAETRAKMSATMTGRPGVSRPLSQAHKEAIRAAQTGVKRSQEAKDRVGAFFRGKPWSTARRAAQLAKKSI